MHNKAVVRDVYGEQKDGETISNEGSESIGQSGQSADAPAVSQAANGASSADAETMRTATLVVYGCLAGSILTGGLTSIIAVILAYLKRGEAQGTIYEGHLSWAINTFWLSLVLSIFGMITLIVGVGLVILIFALVWFLYRVVRGGLAALERKPIKAVRVG